MGTKIHLVIHDSEGDATIAGAYSTHEGARAALRHAGDGSGLMEIDLDAPLPEVPAGRTLWHVYHGTRLHEFTVYRESVFAPFEVDAVEYDDGDFHVNLWARDEEEAQRLAVEQFDRFKAGQGVPV